MFRPVPMLRLSALILQRDKRAVLQSLGHLEAIQLQRTEPGPGSAPLPPLDRTRELAQCDQLLSRLEELRRALAIPDLAPTQPAQLAIDQVESRLLSLERKAGALLQHREALQQQLAELNTRGERAASFCGGEVPLEPPARHAFLDFVLGYLPAENLGQLQKEVAAHVALLPLEPQQNRQPLIALTTHQGLPALQKVLQRAGFQPETFPLAEGATVDQLTAQIRQRQKTVVRDLEQVHEQLRKLADETAPRLAQFRPLIRTERSLLEAEQNFPRTEAALLVSGWVPASDAAVLVQRLREITAGRYLIETSSPEDIAEAEIPVLLRHRRFLQPFAMLVAAYGLPRYHELEPTLFVALSFVGMFGMMFGDAGQGAVLGCAALAMLLPHRKAKVRQLGWLLLLASLSSIVFGLLYGSFFGLPQFKKYALWHDPLEANPMRLMTGAIAIGAGLISLGLVLNVFNHFRRGDILGGCLDKFGLAGAWFYWGTLALITHFAAFQERGWGRWALWLFLGLPLTAWILKGPLEFFFDRRSHQAIQSTSSLLAATTESLVGAFEAVLSYLANTISFVRLAAYALSHAAILMAAFMLAAAVQRTSAAGDWLSVLIIIFGNIMALVLEGLIACIQALRLEYYEFFSKFFSGEGQAFRPFRLAT